MKKYINEIVDQPRVVLLYRASTKKQTDSENDIPWQAEAESIKNSERITHAIEINVKQGKWRGGCAPYGYKTISIGTLNFKGKPIFDVVIDPETSKIVKEIFKLYKEHYGSYNIAKYLNERNIPTKNGSVWRKNQILNILTNKLYIGIYQLGKRSKIRLESPIMEHLRLLSEQEFYEVQELLKKSSDNKARQRPRIRGSRMLNGLLFCECGRKYTSQVHSMKRKRQNGTVWTYHRATYRCDSFRLAKETICDKKPFSAEELENLVIIETKKLISELMIKKRMHGELENWIVHFDAQNIMKKKAILIDIIDKIVIKEDNIDIAYKFAKPPATLNDLLVALSTTQARIVAVRRL